MKARTVVGLMPLTTLNHTRALLPLVSILLASMVTIFPVIASSPVLPPMGLLFLLAWRLLRSDLFPAWIAVPLGFWDDLLSGQPLGSAMLLWTLAMLALDYLDSRLVYRDHWFDWAIATLMIGIALGFAAIIVQRGIPSPPVLEMLLSQWVSSALLFPMVVRIVAKLDSWRRA